MLLFDVTRDFDAACKELLAENPDLLRFVTMHERRDLVLQNLCQQILQYERTFARLNYGVAPKACGPNAVDRKEMIEAVAALFIQAVIEQRKQAVWSSAEKERVRNKDNLRDEMSRLIKEV